MNMLEIPVKLIVKAPNQQFKDQTIHCNLSWTIKRLKGYLSEVYPSRPNTEDQRLIYYGQLLNDSITLKDVFTRYEAGEETHTVHLVCMPSKENLKMQARKVAEEGNKKEREGHSSDGGSRSSDRISVDGSEGTSEQEIDLSRPAEQNYFPSGRYQQYWLNNVYPQPPENYNYMQQLAWMQRIYTNYYMSQYMDMIARQNGNVFREGYLDPRQTEAAHNPEPQPEEEDDDNRANRDWLDYFYTLSRIIILFSIVCFYSSPARFIIVFIPGIMLYMYQLGFFRVNQVQGVENNEVENNNPNPNPPLENDNAPQQAENSEAAPEGELSQSEPNQPEPALEAPERPSFIALTWTFVTSFFSSMIPELQNPI